MRLVANKVEKILTVSQIKYRKAMIITYYKPSTFQPRNLQGNLRQPGGNLRRRFPVAYGARRAGGIYIFYIVNPLIDGFSGNN